MAARPGETIGIIYGEVEATEYKFAAGDPNVKRLDYVTADHPGGTALGQVLDVQRHSQLSFEEAVSLGRHGAHISGDQVSCTVKVIGYRDERGLLQLPRTPFKAGMEVRRATPSFIQRVLGLTLDADHGAYLGYLKGTEAPVALDVDTLVQKHVSVLAKTGAGKSYTVGVIIEELLKKRVPLVIVDPHGEYGTLASPNIESNEVDNLIRFGLKPKSFQGHLAEYTLDPRAPASQQRLTLDASNLEAREILDLLGGKVSTAQQGLLYQAVNDLKKTKPAYQFRDLIEELTRNPSNAKWPLVSALETLESTKLFSAGGTKPQDLVKAGQAALLNLKGAAPEIQEVAVARLARMLFDARKRNLIPPFMFVVEEAHNFCPERTIATALSGAELRTIASEGRKFGMGLLIVSQRPAKVDKNVLSQCNTQIIMKVTNPNDLKAITASVEGLTSEAADEIQRLGTGVCLVAGGSLALPILVEVRTRQTRHGGKSVSVFVEEEEGEETLETTPPAPSAAAPSGEPHEPFVNVEEAPEPEPSSRVPVEPVRTDSKSLPGPWSPHAPHLPEKSMPPLVEGEMVIERAPRKKEKPVAPPTSTVVSTEEPRLVPSVEPEDLAVHRVVGRVGYASVRSAREAVAKVKEMARGLPHLSPEDYVRAFARIGHLYCYPAQPECGPCPLLRTCRLGMERLGRGEVREGKWGVRPQ